MHNFLFIARIFFTWRLWEARYGDAYYYHWHFRGSHANRRVSITKVGIHDPNFLVEIGTGYPYSRSFGDIISVLGDPIFTWHQKISLHCLESREILQIYRYLLQFICTNIVVDPFTCKISLEQGKYWFGLMLREWTYWHIYFWRPTCSKIISGIKVIPFNYTSKCANLRQ